MRNKVALIVHSCDRYELLFKGFEYFFHKNWDYKIPCSYYFATEEISVEIKNFLNIKSGKGQWSNRLLNILNQIEEEYVVYFQEDMWLNKPVDKEFFIRLFNLTVNNNWKQVKLNSSNVFKTQSGNLFIEGFNISKIINKESNFLMSHQVTLWNKNFLKQQLKSNEHPWRNERKGTKRLRKLDPEIFHIDYFAENGSAPINQNGPIPDRSEYFSISINGILNHNILSYLSKLKLEDKLSGYADKLTHNYLNKLTHDGKPKPRKIDVFKRVKNWIKTA